MNAIRQVILAIQTRPRDLSRLMKILRRKVVQPLRDASSFAAKVESWSEDDYIDVNSWVTNSNEEWFDLGEVTRWVNLLERHAKSVEEAAEQGESAIEMAQDDPRYAKQLLRYFINSINRTYDSWEEWADQMSEAFSKLVAMRPELERQYSQEGYDQYVQKHHYRMVMDAGEGVDTAWQTMQWVARSVKELERRFDSETTRRDTGEDIPPPHAEVEELYHATVNAREL